MKMNFVDEKTGIEYRLQGDYYIPNVVLKTETQVHLNKYGLLRLEYLKKYKKRRIYFFTFRK